MTMFDADAAALTDRLIAVRRELHAIPEIGLHLPETQRIVLRELAGLGLEVSTGAALSSVTAVLRGARPGPTVLLRGDMDALPIVEDTELAYASTNGAMHACGHDLHMAGLLGAVRLLAARRDELPGTVVCMFQPGEEGYAGGRLMIEEGVLEASGSRPVAAYGLHVDCVTPYGALVTRPGALMASVSALRVTVRGTGGHASSPHLGVDPVPIAAELVLAVQSFAARRIRAADAAVLSVTKLRSDSEAGNIIPASVELELNIRTLSREALALIEAQLPALLGDIARAHGAEADLEWIPSYPVTYNDPAETELALAVLRDAGREVTLLPEPAMASEDFAYVLEQVPGMFLFVGATPEGGAGPMHSDRAAFDDSVLGLQAQVLAELAWSRLQRG